MRINFILGHAFPVPPSCAGGVAPIKARCWEMGSLLGEMGHDVTFYSRRWPGRPRKEQASGGVNIVRVPGHAWTRRRHRDLCHAFLYGLRLAPRVREADIHVCKSFFFPFQVRLLRRLRGVICVGLHRQPKAHLRAYSLLLHDGGGARLRFTAVSDYVRREAEQLCPGMRGRIGVVPNPVDLRRFRPGRERWPEPTVLYVGRIVPEKGLMELADAFVRLKGHLPAARLRLVGPLSTRQNSDERLVRALKGKFNAARWSRDVSFCGFGNGKSLVREYQKAWVVACPSLAGEAHCNVVLEALGCGTPLVSTTFGPFPEMFCDGQEGYQVPPHDHVALADRLARVLLDERLSRRMGQAARRRAARFGLSRIVEQYDAVFRRFVDEGLIWIAPPSKAWRRASKRRRQTRWTSARPAPPTTSSPGGPSWQVQTCWLRNPPLPAWPPPSRWSAWPRSESSSWARC